jgi:DNA repair exonuclease SbcCD ATPase subunit
MKSKVTINVETMLLEEAKSYHVNISKSTEEALTTILNIKKGNLTGAEEMLIRKKLETKQSALTKLQGEVSGLRQQLVQIEEMKNQSEEERLEKQKDYEESLRKCINCGQILEESHKKHNFKKGTVCHGCFMNMTSDSFKRWNNE